MIIFPFNSKLQTLSMRKCFMAYLPVFRWFLMWYSFGLTQGNLCSMNFTVHTHFTNRTHGSVFSSRNFHHSWMRKDHVNGMKGEKSVLNRTIRISICYWLSVKMVSKPTMWSTRNPFNMHANKMGIIKNLMVTIKILCVWLFSVSRSHQVNGCGVRYAFPFPVSFQLNAFSLLYFMECIEQFWFV